MFVYIYIYIYIHVYMYIYIYIYIYILLVFPRYVKKAVEQLAAEQVVYITYGFGIYSIAYV